MLELVATKQVKRTEYTKHPFSKKRLRVLDVFSPAKRVRLVAETPEGEPVIDQEPDPVIPCPNCQASIDKIMVVEPDTSLLQESTSETPPVLIPRDLPVAPSLPYYVLFCTSCNSQSWYVILE